MFKRMSIGARIVIATFILLVFAVLCSSIVSSRNFSNSMISDATDETRLSLRGFSYLLAQDIERAKSLRDQLAENLVVSYAMKSKSGRSILAEVEKLMNSSGLDVITFIAADGTVLARAHNPESFGDNVADEQDFKEAMVGRKYEWLMSAPALRFGYYCGAPIYVDKEIVGMVRVAVSMTDNATVDRIKEMFGVEATIFAGKTRVNTTIVNEGKRVVDTDASPEVVKTVLEDGGNFESEISIFGKRYIACYMPLKDSSGSIKGMLFVGNSLENILPEIKKSLVGVALVSIVILLIALAISISIGRMISKPLGRIVQVAARSREGDLTIKREDFGASGGGELATLVDSIHDMISAQVMTLGQVVDTSEAVRGNTDDLRRLSNENNAAMADTQELVKLVSELCEDNSVAVSRGNKGIADMADGVTTVASMSTESASSLLRTTDMSRGAIESVNTLVAGIGDVDAKTLESQRKIRDLSDSVREISNFMGVIGSIADQTNLLALNAAIEAARAGEAGRGFAVVAEEVRKLAEESRNAAKSVEELVLVLSSNADDAIGASEDSVKIVSEITTMTDKVLSDLGGVMDEISNANEAVQSIAAAAEEQAASSVEISGAMEAINDGTGVILQKMKKLHEISDRAAEVGNKVASSSEEMERSVEELKNVLNHFKMD